MEKVRWGVLGAARIATNKVIPAMRQGEWSEVVAIASRDSAKAASAAQALGIRKAYGSYEELLADPEIEAVYNPLPNHLHVPWSIRAAEAGKHVLCEKPLSLTVAEARKLVAVRDRTGVKIGEAFMVQTHPQWLRAVELARGGKIGEIRAVSGFFSYFNDNPNNIRNVPDYGGGGLMDIGCYAIKTSRMIFGQEPARVLGTLTRDPSQGVDILTSAILEYPGGHAIFTCATRIAPYQRVQIVGTRGRIEVEIPFNAPPERPARIFVDDASSLTGSGIVTEEFAVCNQYTIQGDAFSRAVRGHGEVPVPLEDALANMAVIEAVERSSRSGRWEEPAALLKD